MIEEHLLVKCRGRNTEELVFKKDTGITPPELGYWLEAGLIEDLNDPLPIRGLIPSDKNICQEKTTFPV